MEINIFFERNFRVVAIIKLKRDVAGAGISGIIVGKFRHKQ